MQTQDLQFSTRIETEAAIHFIKAEFEKHLKHELSLFKVSAPAVVLHGTGVNDDLNGIERPVGFPIKGMQEQKAEVVQSLAKWKRLRLKHYELEPGTGIITDMKALRPDEDLGPFHSIYVDQWDWEKTIAPRDRELEFLKQQVRSIYAAMIATETAMTAELPHLKSFLPPEITFIHAEELLERYPQLTPKERENMITREFGAVFLIGIGGDLDNGVPHDGRAPDYDDWSTPTSPGTKGLNGDLLVWNPIFGSAMELSSMGIRVDAATLAKQLQLRKAEDKQHLYYHQLLLQDQLPQTIGGGIGQSRFCMFLLQKKHIGEVQVSIWPQEMIDQCEAEGIFLL